jgi:hypothetical protein
MATFDQKKMIPGEDLAEISTNCHGVYSSIILIVCNKIHVSSPCRWIGEQLAVLDRLNEPPRWNFSEWLVHGLTWLVHGLCFGLLLDVVV